MSNLSQFIQSRFVPTEINRPFGFGTETGKPMWAGTAAATNYNISRKVTGTLSGACTANTLKTIYSYTGPGCLAGLLVAAVGTTSRTHRLKVTLDGVVVFDKTTAANAVANVCAFAVGEPVYAGATSYWSLAEERVFFNDSILIEYASSTTVTDQAIIGHVIYKG